MNGLGRSLRLLQAFRAEQTDPRDLVRLVESLGSSPIAVGSLTPGRRASVPGR